MKKSVGIMALFLIFISIGFVSAQQTGTASLLTDEWDEEDHRVWHDADDIKVSLGLGGNALDISLQDWIDAFDTTEPPVETEEFLQSGSIISIKGKSEGNFLSINSPIISMSDGLYANREEAKLWENFEINLDEGSGDIMSGDTIELISQKTEASLQVVNSGS